MLLRGVVLAIVPTLGLLSALWAAGPIPDWRPFPNDASAVGKRTSRQRKTRASFVSIQLGNTTTTLFLPIRMFQESGRLRDSCIEPYRPGAAAG